MTYYSENKEKAKACTQKWQAKNPTRVMWNAAKARAKRKGIPFDISWEEIVIPDVCPVLGIPLSQGSHTHRNFSPSLDRIDLSRGYVTGNIAVISSRANRIKSDATLEELQKITAWVQESLVS